MSCTEYGTFLIILKKLRIRFSEIKCEADHWNFLRIEIEFQSDFSKFVFNSYIPF